MTYYTRDLFTGDDVPAYYYNNAPEAWLEGWNASMDGGLSDNPYDPCITEGREWRDGYDAAERD